MSAPATRQHHLAAIHMAQKALHLSKEDASALKFKMTGKYSAADMTALERRQYLARLSELQAQVATARGEKPAYTPQRPPAQRSTDDDQDERWSRARALWADLARAGEVRADTDSALQAYAKRQTKVDAWRFMNGHQINNVIEALKRWCRRVGVPTEPTAPASTKQ